MSEHMRHTLETVTLSLAITVVAIVCLSVCMHRASVETFAKTVELVQQCEEKTAAMEGMSCCEAVADIHIL